MIGILGRKVKMTRIYGETGELTPVTVIESAPCPVVQVKDKKKDGYNAIQIGYCEAKEKKLNKSSLGKFKKIGIAPCRYLREIRLDEENSYKVGDKITVEIFKPGDFIDVTGRSIGKGFQGGVKRWHWAGGPKSHGSTSHRAPGSIGSSTTPGRVIRGHHLPGRMGGKNITTQNLRVLKVDTQNNLLVVKGAVAGYEEQLLFIKKAKKRQWKSLAPPAPVKPKEKTKTAEKAKKPGKPAS